MLWLLRVAAYAVSAFSIWSFVQGGHAGSMDLQHHLAVDAEHGMIFGVCAGLSNYTGLDVSLIRFFWSLTAMYKGLGVILYVLAFLIMPLS